jgi:uncharacterized protein (DUF433 family)
MCEERIVCIPGVLGGKPVIKGTRISVELILEEMSGGSSAEELAREFSVELTDVHAALAFAAAAMRVETVYPIGVESA